MWTNISSQDFPYPSRSRCTDSYQAPHWKTFTSPGTTLADKTSPLQSTQRVIRADSVAAIDKVHASVTPLQSLPFPTRVKQHDLSSFLNEQDSVPLTDASKHHQLLGLKSLYRSPHRMQSIPKSTYHLNFPTTPSPNPLLCTTPSSLYIDIHQLLPPPQNQDTVSDTLRKIRFVRSSLNTPLYDLQLRNEVHTPTQEMKRKMVSLTIQGSNRSSYRHSRKYKRNMYDKVAH